MKYSLFLLSLFIVACSVKPVTFTGEKEKLSEYKKVSVIEFIIGPHYEPTFPLIDAGIFNAGLDDVADQILKYNHDNVDKMSDYFGEKLIEISNFEVRFGQELYTSDEYQNLINSVTTFDLGHNDDDYIQSFVPLNSMNFFNLYDDLPDQLINNKRKLINYHPEMKKVAEQLNSDLVIVVTIDMYAVPQPGLFTSNWARAPIYNILFFDNTGRLVLGVKNNHGNLKHVGKGSKFNLYELAMEDYYEEIERMLKITFGELENEYPKNKNSRRRRSRGREGDKERLKSGQNVDEPEEKKEEN